MEACSVRMGIGTGWSLGWSRFGRSWRCDGKHFVVCIMVVGDGQSIAAVSNTERAGEGTGPRVRGKRQGNVPVVTPRLPLLLPAPPPPTTIQPRLAWTATPTPILQVLADIKVQGLPRGSEEVGFGKVVTSPLAPDRPLTVVQPQVRTQQGSGIAIHANGLYETWDCRRPEARRGKGQRGDMGEGGRGQDRGVELRGRGEGEEGASVEWRRREIGELGGGEIQPGSQGSGCMSLVF